MTTTLSGKRILVDEAENQADDSLTGNIVAGYTQTTATAGNMPAKTP